MMNLMMLQQSQQHRYDDFLLCLEVLVEIGLVRWSHDEEIKHQALQGRKRYGKTYKVVMILLTEK